MKHVKDSGGIISLIAKRMGVQRSSLYSWLTNNPSFWEYIHDEREAIVDLAESKLLGKIQKDEDWAIKFILGSTNRGITRGYNNNPNIQVNQIDKQQNIQINVETVRDLIKQNEEIWN